MFLIIIIIATFIGLREMIRASKSYTHAKHKTNAAARVVDVSEIDYMDGHEFEYLCADLLRCDGYTNVQVTQGSNDQGVDIIAYRNGYKYAIQCKRYSKRLGNKPIQEVNTGKTLYNCDYAAVITNSYFTPGAVEAANATGVYLWDRDEFFRLVKIKQKTQKR